MRTLLLTQIESRFCIVGTPSHEFIIIAFYDEGAGLAAHVCSILNIPVNNISVMSGCVFLGETSTKQWIKCLAQGHNTATPSAVRLEPATL